MKRDDVVYIEHKVVHIIIKIMHFYSLNNTGYSFQKLIV